MTFMVRKSLKVNQEAATVQIANGASKDAPHSGTVQPQTSKAAQKPEKRVRLSCDITRSLHRRLRMAAAKRDTTIVALIEALIEKGIDPC